MTDTIHYTVTGETKIDCSGCEQRIIRALRRVPGIQQVTAHSDDQSIAVTFEPARLRPEHIQAKLGEIGYEVTPKGSAS